MAQSFSVNVYGTTDQQPPYQAEVNGNASFVQATYPAAQVQLANFPVEGTNVFAISPGVKMIGGVYCYGVVEVAASGLQQYSKKYIVKDTVATLASLRG